MCCLLDSGAGIIGCAMTADGVTVEDVVCELMNISNVEREKIGGEPDPTVKQSILGRYDPGG